MTESTHAELKRLAEAATHKQWCAFTDDSGSRPHTNLVSVVPITDCALYIPGAHKNDPNVAFIAAADAQTILSLIEENERLREALEDAVSMYEHMDESEIAEVFGSSDVEFVRKARSALLQARGEAG